MLTFTLLEAAAFLKIHPEELRQRAKAGLIPGAKVGRAWVFLQDDLAAYLRSLYSRHWQALQVTLRKEVEACHFADVAQSGGSMCSPHPGNEYAALLGLTKKP